MAKKLTVEVDADVSKAKRKMQGLGGAVESDPSAAISPAAKRAADALDNAAKSSRGLSEAAREGSNNMRVMGKLFGGMAVRMATGYAANMMESGSSGQMVVKGLGNVASGALAGSVAGPWGAVAGGAVGAVETAIEAAGEASKKQEDIATYQANFTRGERDYASSKEWKDKLDSLTEVDKGFTDFAGRIKAINDELAHYKEVEQTMIANIKAFAEKGDLKTADLQQGYLNQNRARQAQLEAAAKAMEKLEDKKGTDFRASMEATDALSRIGGGSFGGDYAKQQLDATKEIAAGIKSIDQKTKSGGATWQ